MRKCYALLVGSSNYSDASLRQLALPEADIHAVEAVLSSNVCGFTIMGVMLNKPWHAVQSAISRFFKNRQPNDLLLLYFSGHGVRNARGNLYLAFTDTEIDNVEGTTIADRFIAEQMDYSYAEAQLVVLDCCHAAAFARGETKSPIGDRAGIEDAFMKVIDNGVGRYVLAATGAIQYAYEKGQVNGKAAQSLFTQFFIKGLQSSEADRDHDGYISIEDLSTYIRDSVRAVEPTQEPELFARSSAPVGKLILAQLPIISSPVDQFLDMLPNPPRDGLRAKDATLRSYALCIVGDRLLVEISLHEPLLHVLDYMQRSEQEASVRVQAAGLLSRLLSGEMETIPECYDQETMWLEPEQVQMGTLQQRKPQTVMVPNVPILKGKARYEGRVWRHIPAGEQPLQVGYILRSTGRWNRCGLYGCLYTSLSPDTVIAEYRKYLQQVPIPVTQAEPREAVTILVEMGPVLDLTDEQRSPVPPSSSFLVGDSPEDLEACRSLADYARAQGYAGILAPSSAMRGKHNLIIYIDGLAGSILLDEGPDRLTINL